MSLSRYEKKVLAEYKRKSAEDPDYGLFREPADIKAIRRSIELKIKDEQELLWNEKKRLEDVLHRLLIVAGDIDVFENNNAVKLVKKTTKTIEECVAAIERPSQVEPMPYIFPTAKPDKETPSRKFLVQSFEKMKKKEWIKEGKPNWWVRLGYGKSFRFLKIEDVPGWKPLKVEIDLDAYQIPRGETLYLGVGPYTTGVRDEYFFKVDEEDLRWFLNPIHRSAGDDAYGTESHTWHTRNYRYAICRRIPKEGGVFQPDFMASYNGAPLSHRKHGMYMQTLEDAMHAVRAHWKKRGMREEFVQLNDIDMLIGASMEGLDFLPEPPKPPEEEKPKKKSGVVKAIIRLLKKASKKKPLTKEDIWIELMMKFPERDPDALFSTVGARLADLKKRRGLKVRKSKKGYWI